MNLDELSRNLAALHKTRWGREPEVVAFAPGRAEVLGNHTDYNLGTVLSTAVDMGHCFSVSRNNGEGLRLLAGDLGEAVPFSLDSVGPVAEAPWASYVKGVFYNLTGRGIPVDNLDCSFLGNIPVGSGLSSSAALEVSAAFAAMELYGTRLDEKETAKLCRDAESRFAGCNCGLLDQFSSIFGQSHSLIHTDFRSLEVTAVPLAEDIRFLIVTPQVTHRLSESPYNERRESCEQAVRELSSSLPEPVASLRDVSPADFALHRRELTPEAAKRAAHVIGEIDRVARGVQALKSGDLEAFGDLMYQSHESSRTLFENSAEELDLAVSAAKEAGAPGARLSGGGWGGSLIVLARAGDIDRLEQGITGACVRHGLTVRVRPVVPSDGARILRKKRVY